MVSQPLIFHKSNIVSLEAFDGRMFALYLELLPLLSTAEIQSPFTKSDAHTILLDISSALSYLANLQIAHNDIKPGNIAYSPQRGAVLFDFGAACHLSKKPNIGTAWYLPPESIENHGRGLPGDIWAMGVTMLYVLQKIEIPEKFAKNWDIGKLFRAFEEENAAKVQMRGWLEFIAEKKAELDRKDGTGVENAVYQMLGKRKSRAVARDIEKVLCQR
ncbi:Calcium/calmodulin-dependent protein kinase I [Trichoderma lentiforme]|uniref:Calcium/calmodulin-dependent protein kinase I n=1 Tax=Trichoderma lentiforme TaxID=1567552 RepID=A0A9P4XHX5_9HYPO|nr:Calcium/calmodulin-dependent protein kinase I [Trichoderma lentiforme]